jgi:iron complex transport system substrate-binding protein
MAARLGATNVADGEEDAGPFPGYAQLSIEAILEADPDIIFTVTRGAPTPMAETMTEDPVWSALSAVENGQVYELDNRLFVESPGPRFTEAMLRLFDIFYGESM